MAAIFATPAAVLASLRDRYLQFQALFLVMMVLGLSRSSEPGTAAAMCLIYFSTFIANYITCRCIVSCIGYQRVWSLVCVVAIIAASVGLVEWSLGEPLAFYQQYSGSTFAGPIQGIAHRVSGTLGNPIVFSTALLLIAPLCMLARTPLNLIAVSLCIVAATMTMSRTGVLIAAVYAAVFLIHRFRASLARGTLAVAALAVVLAAGTIAFSSSEADFVRRLSGDDSTAIDNLTIRWDAARSILATATEEQSPAAILTGNGLRASSDYTSARMGGYDTLDNAWLTIFFDTGLLGIGLFSASIASILAVPSTAPVALKAVTLAFVAAGFSFVSVYYSTCNFPAVLALAAISAGARRQHAPTVVRRVVPAPHHGHSAEAASAVSIGPRRSDQLGLAIETPSR